MTIWLMNIKVIFKMFLINKTKVTIKFTLNQMINLKTSLISTTKAKTWMKGIGRRTTPSVANQPLRMSNPHTLTHIRIITPNTTAATTPTNLTNEARVLQGMASLITPNINHAVSRKKTRCTLVKTSKDKIITLIIPMSKGIRRVQTWTNPA